MNRVVFPGPLQGVVTVPSSKSFVHRQMICAALAPAGTQTVIQLKGISQDISATQACVQALGGRCELTQNETRLAVTAGRPGQAPSLDAGESGSTARFLLPVAAALCEQFTLTGHGRLPQRPMEVLCRVLRQNGCRVSADFLPLQVQGRLQAGTFSLPGNISSQYITGLLLAAPLLAGQSTLQLTTPLASAGYLAITEQVLAQFGVCFSHMPQGWRVPGGQQYQSPGFLTAEGDWSSAAFWLVADALQQQQGRPGLTVAGLNPASVQGDRAVLEVLNQILSPGSECVVDIDPVPDLLPVLAVLAAGQPKRTVFANAARLRFKESDRLETTAALLQALGGRVQTGPESLTVTGGTNLSGGTVQGAGDHRIVMAAAVAALLCTGPVTLIGAQAAEKSYPAFFEDFARLGGKSHVV